MPAGVVTNKYHRPPGYHVMVTPGVAPGVALPWNGYTNGANSPAAGHFGEVDLIAITAAPTNLSSLQFFGPNEILYAFQFVETPGLGTFGITVPIPPLATAAQVRDALLAVMSQPSAQDVDGNTITFPWIAVSNSIPLGLSINWTVLGSIGVSVEPDGVDFTVNSTASAAVGAPTQARFGALGAALPGPGPL